MGKSVKSQVDSTVYFSLYTIDKSQIEAHGLNMRIKDLREAARNSKHRQIIYTGGEQAKRLRKTKIYRYEDFKDLTQKIS